ncbi:MAG TPA: hypothetical protein VM513_32180 [Kofleriaceae bacterium]|nr:hypothetical protein [Kofleriaceae bacterium]
MRIVEIVATRTVLVISSLGLAAALAAWATQPEPVAPARQPVRPMRGCVKAAPRVAPAAQPVTAPSERTQVEVVQALRADLARCGEGAVDGSLSIYIDRDGVVRDMKLSGLLGTRPEAMTACVKAVVLPTRFPASETNTAVEMLLRSNE